MEAEQNATKQDKVQPTALDAKLALLLIESPASTDEALADKLGLSRQTVNRRRNSESVRQIIRSTLTLPEKEIRRLAAKALVRLEEMLDNEDPRIKLAAAQAIAKLGAPLMANKFDMGKW